MLEVLACFRPDPALGDELGEIHEDDADGTLYPTASAGTVPRSWLRPRAAGVAYLSGSFCAATSSASIAALRPVFIGRALSLGLSDFDAAALKDSRSRQLTQLVEVGS